MSSSTPKPLSPAGLNWVAPSAAGMVWIHTGSFAQAITAYALVAVVHLVELALTNGFLWTVLFIRQPADVRADMIRAASLNVYVKGDGDAPDDRTSR